MRQTIADESARGRWPVIVGGSHRSGTTLLRHLLNAHSRLYCPSEIKFHADLLGQFPDDPLRHGRLGASIAALGLPTEEWLDVFGRAFVECYHRAAARAGKARWADKAPENALNIAHWERLLNGQFFFVLVVRHPFDIIASMEEAQMNRVIARDAAGRARHILRYIEPGLSFAEAHPDRCTVVHYEAMVGDPGCAMRRLCESIAIDFEPSMLDTLSFPCSGLRGLEDPKIATTERIHINSVGRWRRDIKLDDMDAAGPILAPLMQRLGYEA